MTYFKNLGWALLIVFLMPLWIALALVALVVIVARHLFLFARGNHPTPSRPRRSAWWHRALSRRARGPVERSRHEWVPLPGPAAPPEVLPEAHRP